MSELVRFKSKMTPPPGGKFFLEVDGDRVEAHTWLEMLPKVQALMARHNIGGFAEDLVANYMCPYMPDWYCTGHVGHSVTTVHDARKNAAQYYSRNLVTFDRLSERMRICHDCPKHERDICLTCTGILHNIMVSFGGKRVKVPEDLMSGVCGCAKTFEAVIASVEHDGDPWEGAPDTCWRRTEK